jgi:hypothetical protein
MKLFSSGDYAEARALFDVAGSGPSISVGESAQMYARMCAQRIERAQPQLQTPDDFYNYGISLINSRRYEEARAPLQQAVSLSPQPHYCYALALAEGHSGALAASAAQLRRAVEADPAIRSVARRDADFAPLLHHQQIREALAAEPPPAG